jgi:uncharacterized protein
VILDLEKVTSGDRITGDEVVVVRDVGGEDNRIRCRVSLDVRRSDQTFYVHADVSGSFSTPCHRCLDPASCTVASSFDLVVQKADPHASPGPAPTDEDFVVLPAGENRLELGAYIHENLVLDIPMQILCAETCKGLCSGCGANLNRESCRCEAPVDPRWNELKRLQDGSPE